MIKDRQIKLAKMARELWELGVLEQDNKLKNYAFFISSIYYEDYGEKIINKSSIYLLDNRN